MRKVHLLLFLLFLSFAALQYNDPDAYIWIPVYGVVSGLCLAKYLNKPQKKASKVASIILLIWLATYMPSVIQWIQNGTPNIAGTMKAENPHIELMRETFGLLMCLMTTVYYSIK